MSRGKSESEMEMEKWRDEKRKAMTMVSRDWVGQKGKAQPGFPVLAK